MTSTGQARIPVAYRTLAADELDRIGEIDRSEVISTLYVQEGVSLREVQGGFSASAWSPSGEGEHSVAHQREFCARLLRAGGTAFGAFSEGRLVGIGVVLPHLRPGVSQVAFLYVSAGFRGQGIGVALAERLEQVARDAGDGSLVVSATPSRNTVDFYRAWGFVPTDAPVPELLELEPEDVHMEKRV